MRKGKRLLRGAFLQTLVLSVAVWVLAAGLARADSIVVPNALEATEVDINNAFPFYTYEFEGPKKTNSGFTGPCGTNRGE